MVSWIKLLPIAKIMLDSLNMVLKTETNKSNFGKITKSEIETILYGQVNNVISLLGSMVDENK